jgi:hypothetical protein
MKKIIAPLVIIILLFSSCSDDSSENVKLVGKWKLIEVLADPGDGSGVFRSVNSDKTIEFFSDGTVKSNGSLCYMNIGSDQRGEGTYSLEENTITPKNCSLNEVDIKIFYEFNNSKLILNFFCFEPCREKFVKI